MHLINCARGPRRFNLSDGSHRTLAPGESADLNLAVSPEDDPVLAAWLASGEIRRVAPPPAAPSEEEIVAAERAAEAAVAAARALRPATGGTRGKRA